MLKIAKKNLKGWVIKQGDAFNIPFGDGTFDVIVSFRFVWHFNESDRIVLFNHIRKKLKKDGYFIFDFPNKNVKRFVPYKAKIGKKRVFTKSWTNNEIREELKKNKFTIIKMTPILNDPARLYGISSNSSSFFSYLRMILVNGLGMKEPYNYVLLAKKS